MIEQTPRELPHYTYDYQYYDHPQVSEEVTCPDCYGIGTIPLLTTVSRCEKCTGTGKLLPEAAPTADPNAPRRVKQVVTTSRYGSRLTYYENGDKDVEWYDEKTASWLPGERPSGG